MTVSSLTDLLLNNVLDVKFVRRHPKGDSVVRRMLCTKSFELLNSVNGRVVLNYKPPKKQKQLNEEKNAAVVVWDIIMQDYRVVPVDSMQVINKIAADDTFWEYFNNEIYTMTLEQKKGYMGI